MWYVLQTYFTVEGEGKYEGPPEHEDCPFKGMGCALPNNFIGFTPYTDCTDT